MGSMTRLEDKPNSKCRKWRLFASRGSGAARVQRSRRFEGSWTEAKAALADFEREFAGMPATAESSMPFREYADGWLARREGTVAESTRTKDRRSLTTACWVIGDVPLAQIAQPTLADAYARMMRGESPTGRALSPNYVRQVGVCIGMVLQDAVDRGVLAGNPARGDGLPRAQAVERVPPTAAQVSALLSMLDVADPRQMCAYLCASMGLRKGEALALSWEDVDGAVMHVRKSLRQPRELFPCKTGAGLRDLPIPEHVSEAMGRRRSAAERDRAALAQIGVDRPLEAVCAGADGLRVTSEAMSCWWKRHAADFGLGGFTLHDLRHAYLTAAAVNGVPPRVMQALAGHSSPVTTMRIYAHANMDAKSDAVGIVASVLHPNLAASGR